MAQLCTGAVFSPTLLGGTGLTLLNGATTGYVDAGAGADSVISTVWLQVLAPQQCPPSLVVQVLTPSTSTEM